VTTKEEIMGDIFDEVSKALADRDSRRKALRRMGAGLAGVVGVSVVARPADVHAAPNQCASACADQPGARKAACTQACKECGGDVSRLCFGERNVVCCQGTNTTCCRSQQGVSKCCGEGTYCCNFRTSGGAACCQVFRFERTATTFSQTGEDCCSTGGGGTGSNTCCRLEFKCAIVGGDFRCNSTGGCNFQEGGCNPVQPITFPS
jgi:hypothetical protein